MRKSRIAAHKAYLPVILSNANTDSMMSVRYAKYILISTEENVMPSVVKIVISL